VHDAKPAARRPLPDLALTALRKQRNKRHQAALVMGFDDDDGCARGQQFGERVGLGGCGHGDWRDCSGAVAPMAARAARGCAFVHRRG